MAAYAIICLTSINTLPLLLSFLVYLSAFAQIPYTNMAFKTKFISVVVMAVLLVFLVLIQQQQQQHSDYGSGHGQIFGEGPSLKIQNRKVVVAVERTEEGLRKDVHGWRSKSARNDREKLVDWELRKVPSGPDPLHHNGGSPKKPRTP